MKKIKKTNWVERLLLLWGFLLLGSGIPTSVATGDPFALLFPFVLVFPFFPFVLLIWSKKRAAVYTALYILLYAVLSFNGKCHDYIGGGGGSPPIFYPLGMENNRPSKSGRIKTEYPNEFGWMFWPLLLFDQSFIHKSADIERR